MTHPTTTLLPNPPAGERIPDRAVQFLDLVDDVLVSVGRQRLDRTGTQPDIIGVQPEDRVLQILAGPGSGKTEMLVWRVLFELVVHQTPAEQVLVTTFTRKAATELEVRLVERSDLLLQAARARGLSLPDPHVHDVLVGTLHSLCDRLLRQFDPEYMAAGTELLDEHESLVRLAREYRFRLGFEGRWGQRPRLVNRLLDADGLVALFRAPWDDGHWPSNNMDRVKFLRALLDQHTETWVPRCAATGRPNGVELVTGPPGLTSDLVDLHDRWVEYLDQQGVLDFATVQERFHQRQDRVLERVAHVFVDEFQDTNPIQLAIHTRWLQRPGTRLTVVGDDDQSIYRFRGSDIGCFIDLEKICTDQGVAYRQELLEENWRSTRNIVGFSEAFRRSSVLGAVGMPKTLRPAPTVAAGVPVRLLIGEWPSLAAVVAAELKAEQVDLGQAVEDKVGSSLDAAILLFSTSEKSSRNRTGPAADLRQALEARGLRVYNPRNKTAGRLGSPVHDLLALISYLIDPVRKARVNGRMVEVNATHRDQDRWASAEAAPPPYRISDAHATFQKQFRKSEGGNLDIPSPAHADLLAYVDNIRTKLVNASKLRLTLSGFVARLLSFRRFRNSGYTPQLFRQALFTALLEANIAPSRRTRSSLDEPMQPLRTASGQIEWPKQFWQLLDVFGGLLHSTDLDDEDVEAFSDNAVAMLTFHQAKGLEFDHVYVGSTGRDVTPDTALRTALFSGQTPRYSVADGHASTRHRATLQLAQADREREVYVALTRAKSALTFLAAPGDSRPFMSVNPAIAAVFDPLRARPHPGDPQVAVKAFTARPGA